MRLSKHVDLPGNPKVIDTVKHFAGRDRFAGFGVASAATRHGWPPRLMSSTHRRAWPPVVRAQPSARSRSGNSLFLEGPFRSRRMCPEGAGGAQTGLHFRPCGNGRGRRPRRRPSGVGRRLVRRHSGLRERNGRSPGGSSDAPVADPGFRPELPGVTHISEGDSGELVVAPFTGVDPYKVRFTAGNDPLMLDLRRGQQEAPDAMTRWNDVVAPPNSEFTLVLGADGAPR